MRPLIFLACEDPCSCESTHEHPCQTHARALLVLSQRTAPALAGNDGAIVAISSLGARRVYDGYAAFGTAKAAIETLVRYAEAVGKRLVVSLADA